MEWNESQANSPGEEISKVLPDSPRDVFVKEIHRLLGDFAVNSQRYGEISRGLRDTTTMFEALLERHPEFRSFSKELLKKLEELRFLNEHLERAVMRYSNAYESVVLD